LLITIGVYHNSIFLYFERFSTHVLALKIKTISAQHKKLAD